MVNLLLTQKSATEVMLDLFKCFTTCDGSQDELKILLNFYQEALYMLLIFAFYTNYTGLDSTALREQHEMFSSRDDM